jgi:hypothetical protein
MERGLLSDKKLAEFYDDVVWLYLYQDFSDSPADRVAQRVAIRFGISAWPQHFLVDPYTLEVIADTGRNLASFANAAGRAKVGKPGALTPKALREADARAAKLEDDLTDERATAALRDKDIVVRYRALQHLKESRPEAIVAAAGSLLNQPNDQVRFLVCEILSTHGKPEHEEILVSLVRDPAGSKNPNVLRIRAVAALGHLGKTEKAVEAIRPYALAGDWFNGLTSTAINALAAIGIRSGDHRAAVHEILIASYPAPPAPDDPRTSRACRALAMRVHRALERLNGKSVPFPETYDNAARTSLRDAW